jgi:serine/threonine protein kinase/Tfp pilus assembly protein PilF
MDKERLKILKNLFEQAVDLTVAAREAFLRRECAGDAELFEQAMEMITADSRQHGLLDGRAIDSLDAAPMQSYIGREVGAYRILHEIGSGGMGKVFLAERTTGQFQQQVALKLMKHGLDSEAALKRFRSEVQIMARLQHPNIARLYDGGINEDGLSYFTMEYIEGVPIDIYCDENQLPVRERLKLFQIVCSAVQYAHRNLIIHRDIKPGNILVAGKGVVKLLDFGIAKALSADDLSEHPEFRGLTKTGMFVLTPEYAAPEQSRGDPVTTATDVYSLGMVLYELLAGHRPYDLNSGSPAEVEKIISTTEPEKPSTAIRKTETQGKAKIDVDRVSKLRSTHPKALRKELSGDLDNICLKALRKEPERRYDSAGQLMEDIDRYLNGFPVLARPDTFFYRTGKFMRRHRTGLAAVMAIFLIIGIITTFYTQKLSRERDRAQLEAHKAEQVSQFLTDLFELSDPSHSKGKTITARELLDKGAVRIEKELAQQPEIQATLTGVIGEVYMSLGLYDEAEPLLRKALRIQQNLKSENQSDVAKSMNKLAMLMRATGHYDASDSLLQAALKMQVERLGPRHPDVAETMSNMAWLLHDKGDLEGSEKLYRQAIDIWKENFGVEYIPATVAMNDLALSFHEQGKNEQAEALYRKALKVQRKLLGDVHPEVATTSFNLAQVLRDLSNFGEAEAMFHKVLALDLKLLGPDHPTVAFDLTALAQLVELQGKPAEADSFYRRALEIRKKSLGDQTLEVLYSLNNLGAFLTNRGKFQEAETFLREAIRTGAKIFGEEHPEYARSQYLLGNVFREEGRPDSAEILLRQALGKRRKLLGNEHPYVAHSLLSLADLLLERQHYDEAEKLMKEAMRIRQKVYPTTHWQIATGSVHLAELYQWHGKLAKADSIYRQALGILSAEKSMRKGPQRTRVLADFGRLLLKEGKRDSAKMLLQQVLGIEKTLFTEDHPEVALTKSALGECLVAEGRFAKAESYLLWSYPILKKRYGRSSPVTIKTRQRLFTLYRKSGQPKKAALYHASLPVGPESVSSGE